MIIIVKQKNDHDVVFAAGDGSHEDEDSFLLWRNSLLDIPTLLL